MRNALLALALVAATGAFAAGKPCSPNDAKAAEKAIDKVVDLSQLEKAYRDYGHCDSGPVADQFTDALLRLVVDWKDPEALARAMKDPGFHGFVIAHLKSDAAKEDRPTVYSRAKTGCPRGEDLFCAELADATAGK